jgi:hypothetical protein
VYSRDTGRGNSRGGEAYMVRDAVLLLVEAQRGDAAPAPDLLVRELQCTARRHLRRVQLVREEGRDASS